MKSKALHPNYRGRTKNNIAIITVDQPLSEKPACIPSSNFDFTGRQGIGLGNYNACINSTKLDVELYGLNAAYFESNSLKKILY